MNFVALIGNLTKDPTIRTANTNDGEITIASFSLAINNGKEETLFVNCVAFGQKATLIKDHTCKGNKLGITGKLSSRSYEKDGNKITVFEVIVDSIEFLTPKKVEDTTPFSYVGDRTLEENEKEFRDIPSELPF